MTPNIIIISTDSNIKSFLRTEFAKQGMLLNTDISNIAKVSDALMKNKVNMLIVDVDTVAPPPETIKNLINVHKVFIIAFGIKNAASVFSAGVRGAFSKPPMNNPLGQKILLRHLIDRIEFHMRSYIPPEDSKIVLPAIDLSAAVDINSTIITIAASTGGTEALYKVISSLPARVPPILIVQHMPSVFTYQFAGRLNLAAKFTVKEAAIKESVKPNQAIIAPGGLHMKAVKHGKKLGIECFEGAKVHGVIPAADVLFNSLAEFTGKNVIGVVLTGMGSDGARGLFKLKSKGAVTIAQNKETCVVYGMPKAAVDLGIVDHILPIDKIAEKIMSLVK